jgi:Zc3h12a-like Ribonuclease NYN domain
LSVAKNQRPRIVVDGSNLATEGRTLPSLEQLNDAVKAFEDEHPGAEMIVVADASFEHRVAPSDRARFKEAELAGTIVTPPAGAIGRGDAFILKIAERVGGVVLSNDSFQEFQDEHPWLFEAGRLIGGKPVRGVGWVFTQRQPVRNTKTPRPVKKLSVALPSGEKPTIGTTLTPVKTAKAPVKKTVAKSAKAPAKPVKKIAKVTTKTPAKKLAAKAPVKKTVAKSAKAPAKPVKKIAKVTTKTPAIPPVVALRRGRQPVNPESVFTLFRSSFRTGTKVEGEVTAFTSHGAVINVALKDGTSMECYAPTTLLGTPAPQRARDILKRGDKRVFRLVSVDAERRIAELALP